MTAELTDNLREALEWALDEAETAAIIETEASKDERFTVRAYERADQANRLKSYAKEIRLILGSDTATQ